MWKGVSLPVRLDHLLSERQFTLPGIVTQFTRPLREGLAPLRAITLARGFCSGSAPEALPQQSTHPSLPWSMLRSPHGNLLSYFSISLRSLYDSHSNPMPDDNPTIVLPMKASVSAFVGVPVTRYAVNNISEKYAAPSPNVNSMAF